MEIRHLRSFIAVAETGSFSIAAQRCFVTQSAISQHIKKLEDEFRSCLFCRTAHSCLLTENGATLLPYAKKILQQEGACKEHIRRINNCMDGELNIGVGAFATPYIRMVIAIVMERYPQMRIHAEFAKSSTLNSMLRSHHINVAFALNDATCGDEMEIEPCIPVHIRAIMCDTHPLAQLQKVSFEDLLKYNIILPDTPECLSCSNCDISKLHIKCTVGNSHECLALAEETRCVTLMPTLNIRNHSTLTARPVVGLEQPLTINVSRMCDIPIKRSIEAFIEILKEEVLPYLSTVEKAM